MDDASTAVAESDHSAVRRTLHLLLAPKPGRLRNTFIQVASVLAIASIWEVFRIPKTAVACYFVLLSNRNTRTETSAGAIGVGLSEPAIRICLMAVLSFCALPMSRASTAGTGFFAAGFLVVSALTSADSIEGSSLQTGMVSNTTSGGPPNILPVSMIAAGSGTGSTPERKQALARWFDDVAGRLQEDRLDAGSVALSVVASATTDDDETAWLLLERDLTAVLTQTDLRTVRPA